MPYSIVNHTLREIEPLKASDLIGPAAKRLIDEELPGLPAIEDDGSFAGMFGEREFMAALFPGYVGELASAAMISRSVDETIERRIECAGMPIRRWLTTDRVVVEDAFSDTEVAEIFLHHRVLVVPVATKGKVHSVITRHDFFSKLVERFGAIAEDHAD